MDRGVHDPRTRLYPVVKSKTAPEVIMWASICIAHSAANEVSANPLSTDVTAGEEDCGIQELETSSADAVSAPPSSKGII